MYTHKLPTDDELTALSDWHRGRTKFGLWYVQITCPDVLAHCCANRQKLTTLLAPNYHRQFHVTVFVGGFWVANKVYDDEMTWQDVGRQVEALSRLGRRVIRPFYLTLSNLCAFDNCVVIKTRHSDELHRIRHALSMVHGEIAPGHYVPHVTLGFYQDSFLKADVLEVLRGVPCRPMSFGVDKLTFGYYQATQGQGRLTDVMVWDLR
ncbi:MAG: 2'-5' RNA ligase family protein [Moraxella sp.]|nr:2'-5' RNA ligase family protein [Moraxella sp.]